MNSQTVFITGASSSIGEACAIKFAQQGYNLILNARRADKLETLKQELEEQYKSKILLLPFDGYYTKFTNLNVHYHLRLENF